MPGQILVVDDDAAVRTVLRDLLTHFGYRVTEADNGATALRQLEAADALPDLILLDVLMPELGGFEVLAILREHPDWRRLPVVVMTGFAEAAEEAPRFGVDLLRKPFTVAALLTAVERACAVPRGQVPS